MKKLSLTDSDAERLVVQILWEECRTFGPNHGRKQLERTLLEPADFTDHRASQLFQRITRAVSCGHAPTFSQDDEPALREYLDTMDLLNPVLLDTHADKLRDLSMRRKVVEATKEIHQRCTDESFSAADLVGSFQRAAKEIPSRGTHWKPLSETMGRIERHLHDVAEGKRKPSVPTGFPTIDDPESGSAGLQPTLVVIAAMPGVGKSSFEGTMIRNMAMQGTKVAIFSMEDRSEWLGFRLFSHESGLPQFVVRHRALGGDQWDTAGKTFHSISLFGENILIDDRPSLTPAEVLYAARNAITNRGARCIFLDNMTSMRIPRGPRMDLEIQDFLTAARALADETGVPFVVLAHVKRRDDLSITDMPRLTDIAESAAFEKLCRLGFGLCIVKQDAAERKAHKPRQVKVAILKNTNGRAFSDCILTLRPSSALLEPEAPKQDVLL